MLQTPKKFSCDKKILPWLILTFLCLVYGSIFFWLNILKFKSFFAFEWEDVAAQNQIIYNIASSFSPHQTIEACAYFDNTFKPIYFFVAFFYKIIPHIYTGFFLVSFSYGLCGLIVYKLAENILKDKKAASLIFLIYLFFAPLHCVTLSDVYSVVFALPLLFLMIYFLNQQKIIPFFISTVFFCFCREDMPLVVFLFGIYLIIKRYPRKWWMPTVLYAVVYGAMAVYFSEKLCRVANESPDWQKGIFFRLDPGTIASVVKFIVFNPDAAFARVFDASHLRLFTMMLGPLLFLPLFSWPVVIPAAIYAEILLKGPFSNGDYHYLAPIIPFLFLGFIFTIKKIRNQQNRLFILSISLVLCIWSVFSRNMIGNTAAESGDKYIFDTRFLDVINMFDKRIYAMDDEDRLAWEFIKMIPADASVTASGDLLPALSLRRRVYKFGCNHPFALWGGYTYDEYPNYDVDYILIHTRTLFNGLSGHYAVLTQDDLKEEVKRITEEFGFMIESRKGNFILLKRTENK